jgi:hypothetical protein
MPNTLNLIAQVRRRVPRETDYAVAKALEMSQSNLTRVLAGKSGLGPKAAIRVSEILQRDLRDVLVLIEEDKAKTAHHGDDSYYGPGNLRRTRIDRPHRERGHHWIHVQWWDYRSIHYANLETLAHIDI